MYIYKITNKINNKIYIGKSSKIPKKSESYFGSGILIKKAINQYGISNFEKEILEDNIQDINSLNQKEIYWIRSYNSIDRNIGYNLCEGGEGTIGYVHRSESIDKMKEKSIGRKQSNSTIDKKNKKLKGKKRSEESRNNISEGLINYYRENPDLKIKLSMQQKERWLDPDYKKRQGKLISESQKNKILTEEHRKNISESLKGKNLEKRTEEHRKNISESLKGREALPKTKDKMSVSRKKYLDNNPKIKEDLSKKQKENWANPEYRLKMLESRKKK